MDTRYTPFMTFILRLTVICIASAAWTYSKAQTPDDGLTSSTHFIVIIRDTLYMQRYIKTVYNTLPVLLFDGSNPKQSGLPLYKSDQDRISIVLASIRKKTRKPECNFQFSAAPEHYFKSILKLSHPKSKMDFRDLIKKSIKPDCSFKGDHFSSELARANVISYIQEQLKSTQQDIPNFSSFTIVIVDFEAPSYSIKSFLKSKVHDVALAVEAEKKFYNSFIVHSPASWMFTVETDGKLVRSTEINLKAKLRYRISSAIPIEPIKEQLRELKELRVLIADKKIEIANAIEVQTTIKKELEEFQKNSQNLEQELEESQKNGKKLKQEITQLKIKIRNFRILKWILLLLVVLGAVGVFLLAPKLLRKSRFQVSIPEK
jgi:hypothetical protein